MADPPSATSDAQPPGDELEALRREIGHTFTQPDLLLDALTHRSFVHEFAAPGVVSNERLEFLGDAALALVSADYLYRAAPDATEGDLTAVRAALVRASTLATLARQLRLGRYLRLGRGEEATGGRQRDLLLASAFEAVLGALFLDGGLAAVRALLEPRLAPLARDLLASGRVKDDKSLLQEQAQAQLGITPTYHVVESSGPSHQPSFTVEVRLGERAVGRGGGRNKRQAEQAAAHEALGDPGWLGGAG
ncbi:MAG TPA: ribonuclease III [Ktedonobacterales bacterium]|jgi:ribonuclease-3